MGAGGPRTWNSRRLARVLFLVGTREEGDDESTTTRRSWMVPAGFPRQARPRRAPTRPAFAPATVASRSLPPPFSACEFCFRLPFSLFLFFFEGK